jgi:hypothetical protein
VLLLDLAVAVLAASGPFASLDAYCQTALWDDEKPSVCRETDKTDQVPIPKMTGSGFRDVKWIQVGRQTRGDYRLAIRGEAGWFVDEKMSITYSDRGRAYSRVNSIMARDGLLLVRSTIGFWRKPITDAQLEEPEYYYDLGQLTVCGIGPSRKISCSASFAVAGKLEGPREQPQIYRFDAFRKPDWELIPKFERDGVTFAAPAKPPSNLPGVPPYVYDEAARTPGHHPLPFP